MMISPNVILDIINKLIICKSSIKKIMKSKVLSYLDIYSSIPKVYINQQSFLQRWMSSIYETLTYKVGTISSVASISAMFSSQ